jgi:hypothetical protein
MTRPWAILGAVLAIGGLLLLFVWLAMDGPWAARGRIPNPWDWIVALVLLGAGIGLLLWNRSLSSFDVLVSLVAIGLLANTVLAAAGSGHLNCLIGPEPAAKAADTAVIRLPHGLLQRVADVRAGDAVRVVVVARHHKPNDEEAIESTTYKGTFREAPTGTGSGSAEPMVEIERGDNDADLATFLGALADAETIAVFTRETSPAVPPTTSCF